MYDAVPAEGGLWAGGQVCRRLSTSHSARGRGTVHVLGALDKAAWLSPQPCVRAAGAGGERKGRAGWGAQGEEAKERQRPRCFLWGLAEGGTIGPKRVSEDERGSVRWARWREQCLLGHGTGAC